MEKQLIECVPNFSEGRNPQIIKLITDAIESVEGIKLLDVDPGKATNRTVVTFVGEPELVIEAAYRGIKKAAEVIDMSKHTGEHPRAGATDVCPLIPIANISMEETVAYAKRLGERVGNELSIPVYLYEYAASEPKRRNLANIRAGEYEGFPEKIRQAEWKPDYGQAIFNARSGVTVIGARDLLVAYNVNLNTTSVRRANAVAFDVREAGRIERKGHPVTGEIVKDENGEPKRIPGTCKSVKGIGWYIEEYGIAQISMNLTNLNDTPLHVAFDEVCKSAESRGMRVTGSELVGLVPLKSMLDAGKFFLKKQQRSVGVSEDELVMTAVRSMGLSELKPFEPRKRIIEYLLEDVSESKLVSMNLTKFADETASESPAPGGGSISAYVGALGVSLATMVANLSSHKVGWEEQWETFSEWAEKGQVLKNQLLKLVDADTQAFNAIMAAFQLPKESVEEKAARKAAIQKATLQAIEIPFTVMQKSLDAMQIIKAMAETGNPNSVTDAGVGALCARAAVLGAFLNVKINCASYDDKDYVSAKLQAGEQLATEALLAEKEILAMVEHKIQG
ncbi:MAG: glutamate formimidoyltransferase [Chitinophagales bacterium]|nr:glutamate formimidoyltransferase [Chitinophagales bacterium]